MTIRVITIPTAEVTLDEARFPDADSSWVYDHLLHYCSLFEPLPAITVRVEQGCPIVTQGHNYLRIARDLRRSRIRAVIDPASDERAVEALMGRPYIETLDWGEIDRSERAAPVVEQWHVFYFARPPTDGEKRRFEHDVADFFEGLDLATAAGARRARVGDVLYNDADQRAEFLARTPVADESWYARHLATVTRFSRTVVPIVSYQGRRFEN